MSHKTSISRSFLVNMCVVAIASIALLGCLWTWNEYTQYHEESSALREKMLDGYKDLLRNEVQKAVDYVQFMKSRTEDRLQRTIKTRVYEAHAIATNIYQTYREQKSPEEIQDLIKAALRPIRFSEGRGYYFATNLNGVEELFADHPEMEGVNMLPVQGGHGEYVVQDMIDLVKKQGEGYYTYYWSKPNQPGAEFPKVTFVKLFEPYNWLIGTGEYLDDVEKELQQEALVRLGNIRFGKDGYIFAGTWDGVSLLEPAKGKNMLNVADVNGVRIVQELIRHAKSGGGFVNYVMPKFPGLKPDPKLSYAQGILDWKWYIGAGVYIDDVEAAVAKRRALATKKIIGNISLILIILVTLMAFVYLAARRTASKTEESFALFASFFEKAASESVVMEPFAMHYHELENLATSANRMVEARMEVEQALKASEEKYRLIVENQNDLVVKFNRDRELIFVSPTYCDLFGKREDELVGRKFIPLIHEDDREVVLSSLGRMDTPPYRTEHEERAYTRKGWRWLSWSNRGIPDEDGRPFEYLGVGRDITDKKLAEEALLESEEWLRSILDSIQVGVAVINAETHEILDLNRAAIDMVGTDKAKIVTCRCNTYICTCAAGECPITDLGQTVNQSECYITQYEGRRVPVLKTVTKATINKTNYLIESFIDISEMKRLEARLQQSQKMEAIGTLAGGIAHDFNNILGAIIGYTELSLFDIQAEDPPYGHLQHVLQSAQRAKDLVKQILTFSRQEEKQLIPVEITPIIKEVLKFLRSSLPTTIEIHQDIPTARFKVLADPTQIYQVMMNLATNAAYAMREKGGVLGVRLAVVNLSSADTIVELEPGSYLNLTVSDTGHGMDKMILARVFEPYFTTKRKGEGTGMGLAVVHGIVSSYGGAIKVYSEPGQGTTFSVLLPMAVNAAEAEIESKPAMATGTERILYVDDEKLLVDAGRQMLERLGYRVETRMDSREALEEFRSHQDEYDMVITDLTMPHLTGTELAVEILALRPSLPIILCTGFSESHDTETVKKLGIKAFLFKPIIMQDLAETIRSVIDSR